MVPSTYFALLILLLIIGTIFKISWLTILAVCVGIIMLAAHFWQKQALKGVTYRRRWHYRRGFPGEQTSFRLEVENGKKLPLSWLRIIDKWPTYAAPKEEGILTPTHVEEESLLINQYSMHPREKISRSYDLEFQKRGVYPVGLAKMESGDIFGFFTNQQEIPGREYLTVFPRLLTLPRIQLETNDPFGDRQARRRLFEDPTLTMGIRPYQPEDDFRRIHWPGTARTGSLQVKVYQPVSARKVVICLNVSTTESPWMGLKPELLEHLASVAATIIYQAVQDGYAVGLISNGCLAHADQSFQIPPGRTPEHLGMLLSALAGVTSFTTAPFESFLVRTLPGLPYGASLVIITPEVSLPLAETLVSLKKYRAHTTLISIDTMAPPHIPGVSNLHLPFQEDAA